MDGWMTDPGCCLSVKCPHQEPQHLTVYHLRDVTIILTLTLVLLCYLYRNCKYTTKCLQNMWRGEGRVRGAYIQHVEGGGSNEGGGSSEGCIHTTCTNETRVQ